MYRLRDLDTVSHGAAKEGQYVTHSLLPPDGAEKKSHSFELSYEFLHHNTQRSTAWVQSSPVEPSQAEPRAQARSPGYSPLSAPSPHSLTHCTGYRRAHTLSRSLRDRQLAPAYYTPPPNLLGLATVQIEKSHIPLRQAVTHHLNASRLAP
ncbi:unnamed protein product [Fusarium graminearum]|nr:unnamed protein product [Fusarium graminearum]